MVPGLWCVAVHRIDNSEYMRNGDYPPTRFGAQSDAVNVIFGRKTNANPENTVGLMTMAGKSPQVLVTPTVDIGKILTGLHSTQISNEADISTALQVAQLALKHRQNKNQRQRIIVFVGSPLKAKSDEKGLVKLAKKLKKNNVAVDIISFGEDEVEENEGLLRAFVEGVQSGENSHLVSVPTGQHLLSEAILASPILLGEEGAPGGFGGEAAGGSAEGFEFGVDPSLDPELAMALRMSLEEERARQAAQSSSAPAAEGAASSTLASIPENAGGAAAAAAAVNLMDEDAEDEQLAQALLLSQSGASASGQDADIDMGDDGDVNEEGNLGDEEMSDEEAIARAIEMSMNEEENEKKDDEKKSS
ncbi:hypothetical protein FRB99_005317 [Tulasnella sp. 403]|nr:hypothetical protein FRB99_005317 [Tulasnella sp. 403]